MIPVVVVAFIVVLFGALQILRANAWERSRPTAKDYKKAKKMQKDLISELPAIKQIFSVSDFIHVRERLSRKRYRKFCGQRKKLAILGLNYIRRTVSRLYRLHKKFATCTYEPEPEYEFRLFLRYVTFVSGSTALLVCVSLVGPFVLSQALQIATEASEGLYGIFHERLKRINPMRLAADRVETR